MLKHLDLFSGIGGFALAAKWAGFETIQFVEIDSFCRKVLAKNFPNTPIHDDIKTFNFTDKVDLLTGGFPCQPFSVAGNKKGINDARYLWPDMFRIIRQCKPTWIVGENVPGIIPCIDPILKDLETEGYTCQAYIIPASAIGAPHKRDRVWIIAHCDRERRANGNNHREKRHFQIDWKRYVEEIQSEWSQFIPQSWKTFNAKEWLGFIADTDSIGRNTPSSNNPEQISRREKGSEFDKVSLSDREPISDTYSITNNETHSRSVTTSERRESWKNDCREYRPDRTLFNWEEDKPPVPGVDDGLPELVDRNKALGNAIVPQVVYPFLKIIQILLLNLKDKENAHN